MGITHLCRFNQYRTQKNVFNLYCKDIKNSFHNQLLVYNNIRTYNVCILGSFKADAKLEKNTKYVHIQIQELGTCARKKKKERNKWKKRIEA